jgi:hypothetical protein
MRFPRSRRGFTIGLAIWLVWLSVYVHVLHSHPVAQRCRGGAELVRGCEPDAPLEPAESVCIPPGDESSSRYGSLCPICMFLAHSRADRTMAPLYPAPAERGSRLATCTRPTFVATPDQPTASPRAPPTRPL